MASALRHNQPTLSRTTAGRGRPASSISCSKDGAACRTKQAALKFASAYLDENDINIASSREHRLLAAIADRFGSKLSAHSAYVRLAGMQKLQWTRSRLAIHEAAPALRLMAGSGRNIVLFKGAGRIAVEPAAQRGRVAHDIDVLVRPNHVETAFGVLRANAWVASTGASPQYVKSRLPALHSLNFFKGSFGDIDLHQAAYNVSQANAEDDIALWDRAVPAQFCGVDVLAPSPADRVALAIAHGGLDAHTHSDWLVDSAVAIFGGEVDWPQFLERRREAQNSRARCCRPVLSQAGDRSARPRRTASGNRRNGGPVGSFVVVRAPAGEAADGFRGSELAVARSARSSCD